MANKLKPCLRTLASLLIIVGSLDLAQAAPITVFTFDFIDDASRTDFNGFEGLPTPGTGNVLSNGVLVLNDPSEAVYVEGGIRVQQVFTFFLPGEEITSIWTTHFPSEGRRDWYPNGGDDGYTRITLSNGAEFSAIGFSAAGGVSGADEYLFVLLHAGSTVLQGSVPKPDGTSYLGFSGGPFDEVLVRTADSRSTQSAGFFDGTANGFSVDAIEVIADQAALVSEPTTIFLLGLGFIGLGFSHRKR